jgi:AcrR family transcriptional regulator
MGAETGPMERIASARGPAVGSQRARILDAMVRVVYERGYGGASVSSVSARARLSRRTFYELFEGLEECFLEVLDEGYWQASALIAQAFEERERSWVDGVRGALAALFGFFDREPAFAYVLLVEATAAGSRARERREQHMAALTSLIEDRWGRDRHPHPLVPTGVMAALLGVIHTHLVTTRREPLITLLGPLMGLVTAPYLEPRLVTREIERGNALAWRLQARRAEHRPRSSRAPVKVPALLRDPRAHRARACLLHLAEHPGVSNRQLARGVGIARDTHISTLLARLRRAELVVKHSGRPGYPNAWSLSTHGLRVANVLQLRRPGAEHARHAAAREASASGPTINT